MTNTIMASVSALVSPILLLISSFCLQPTQSGFLDEVCSLPADEGTDCPNDQPRFQYFFDKELETCSPFRYKGCGGNDNRFAMQDDCTDSCQVEWLHRKEKTHKEGEGDKKVAEYCAQPKKQGPCRAMIRQWYFDKQSGECMEFDYGGCKGTKNRFNSESQCKAACVRDGGKDQKGLN